MQHNSKYKVGQIVGIQVVHNSDYISYWKILEVINCRVDGSWGFKYRLNESGSLWVKEKDILGLRPESKRHLCTCIGVDELPLFKFHNQYEYNYDGQGNYLVYEVGSTSYIAKFKSRREFLAYFKRGELENESSDK